MTTEVTFRNFDANEHLKRFVVGYTQRAIARFERDRAMMADVVLATVQPSAEASWPDYQCQIVIRGGRLPEPIVISEEATHVHGAVRACISSAERLMKRARMVAAG